MGYFSTFWSDLVKKAGGLNAAEREYKVNRTTIAEYIKGSFPNPHNLNKLFQNLPPQTAIDGQEALKQDLEEKESKKLSKENILKAKSQGKDLFAELNLLPLDDILDEFIKTNPAGEKRELFKFIEKKWNTPLAKLVDIFGITTGFVFNKSKGHSAKFLLSFHKNYTDNSLIPETHLLSDSGLLNFCRVLNGDKKIASKYEAICAEEG